MNHLTKSTGIFLLILFTAGQTLADGMMLTSAPYYIKEPAQQAVITYDDATSRETLSILPSFHGNTHDFAWILPVPSEPVIQEGDSDLFSELAHLTSARYHRRDSDWSGCEQKDYAIGNPDGNGVEIIDSRIVGYYETMTVAADQASALLDSLTLWGFLHEENIDQATDLITAYVDEDFYFVTVRVDSTQFSELYPNPQIQYYGQLDPLTLIFETDTLIYPMRISALSAAESSEVNLFVIGDHRMIFPDAGTTYANRFSRQEYEDLNAGIALRDLLSPGDFLTRLARDFRPVDMVEDITIVRAPTDDEYLTIHYSGLPWMTILLLAPAFLWWAFRRLTGIRKDVRFGS